MGYHEPHLTPWVIIYRVFILKYSWNIFNKSVFLIILKSLKFSSHYYVTIYIQNLLKICHCKKIQVHVQVFLLFKNTGYNVFKVFFGIFHSLN
jgi:hypothetical protein